MNSFILPIPNLYQSVDRPIVVGVVKDLVEKRMLPGYNDLRIDSGIKKARAPGSTIQKGNRKPHIDNRTSIKVEVESEKGNLGGFYRSMQYNTQPIFNDSKLNVSIRPQYDTTIYVIKISVRSNSLSGLQLWANEVRLNKQMGRDRNIHDVKYSYALHNKTYDLLENIHNLRETVEGYGDTLAEYIKKHSHNSMTIIGAGDDHQLVYAETQLDILGLMPADDIEISEISEGVYEGSMVYSFSIDTPLGLIHNYPIMVHQSLMPMGFINQIKESRYVNVIVHSPLMRAYTTYVGKESDKVINIPAVDNKILNKYPSGYKPIVTALMCITNDPLLLNLRELGDISIDSDVLSAIKDFYSDKLTVPYESPFLLTIHKDNNLLDETYLRTDSDLNVYLNEEVDKRHVYRVSFCICVNPHMIPSTYCPLSELPDVREVIADSINGLGGPTVNVEVLPNDLTDERYLNNILPTIYNNTDGAYDDKRYRTGSGLIVNLRLVGVYLRAHRLKSE